MFKHKLIIVLVGLFLMSILSCDKNKSEINRIPSTTGALKCVYELKHEPFRWRVNLFHPFEIDGNFNKYYNRYYILFEELRLKHGILNEDSVIYNETSTGMSIELDYIKPGKYNVLVYWSRYAKPPIGDTVIISGETLVTDQLFDNRWKYKTTLITNVYISADSISIINMDSLLEPSIVKDPVIDEWYLEQVIYSEWDSLKISK